MMRAPSVPAMPSVPIASQPSQQLGNALVPASHHPMLRSSAGEMETRLPHHDRRTCGRVPSPIGTRIRPDAVCLQWPLLYRRPIRQPSSLMSQARAKGYWVPLGSVASSGLFAVSL